MPPSPSVRCSPGREHRGDTARRRGNSFEGFALRAKDDDLALFNDMQLKEREGFLLLTDDDFDDSLSKLRCSTDFNLGISIPARRESCDLLDADGGKNDYDWLLTPPDTPLFTSLDDEDPQPLASRGRPRSQPINISRSSSINEKTRRSSRGTASPQRLSPSPRSSSNFGEKISRPSSAPRSSPPPLARPAATARRPSTPPNKPATPTPRSSTPTLRRMSTGSSGPASSSGRRGISPLRASRGHSTSPKFQGWQSSLPGFSSDAPPNLRTSLSDRPSPHVRGLSPTARSGRGRHSMSPTTARSVSSSHSNEQDIYSSFSRTSVVSSGDDDIDSVHSLAISSSPPTRRNGLSVNGRPTALSTRPSRSSSSSSIPKRSFESVLRQMDHRKTPQNMFRPLLSSVPSTTFYVGKANSTYRPMFSRNSSLTTSTSASSDHGASVAPDMEGSEHDHNDLAGEWERPQDHDNQEVFAFDKADDLIEDGGQELHPEKLLSVTRYSDSAVSKKVDAYGFENSMVKIRGAANAEAAAESTHESVASSLVDGCAIMSICSRCRKRFRLLEVDGETDICQECLEMDRLFDTRETLLLPAVSQDPTVKSEVINEEDASVNEVPHNSNLDLRESSDEFHLDHDNNIEAGPNCTDNSCPLQMLMDQLEPHLDEQFNNHKDTNSIQCDGEGKLEQAEFPTHSSVLIDGNEGTGISVLLAQRPNSNKFPVVQSRSFSATNILCAEPSYVRDNNSAMRRSIGLDSASTSSSADMGSYKRRDVHIQRQISNRKMEMDCLRNDIDARSQCSGSHSDLTLNVYDSLLPPEDNAEESSNSCTKDQETGASQKSILASLNEEVNNSLDCTNIMSIADYSACKAEFVDNDAHINDNCLDVKNTPNLCLMTYSERHHCETSAADGLEDEVSPSGIIANENLETEKHDIILPSDNLEFSMVIEQSVAHDPTCESNISGVATNGFCVTLKTDEEHDSSQGLKTECESSPIPGNEEATHRHSVSSAKEKGVLVYTLEADLEEHTHGTHEESTVIVEGPRGHASRSLTLAEATDSVLFCSSIIHDIANKAAAIGMEKELAALPEAYRPTITIPYKSVHDQNASKRVPNKHTTKSQKFKRKKVEVPTKSPLTESGSNVIVQEPTPPSGVRMVPSKDQDSLKPPKLESKCNCTVM